MDEDNDFYKVLNIDKSADPNSIKKAYYRLARQYHPDKSLAHAGTDKEKFQQISNAYDTLGNSDKRGYYDFLSSLQTDLGDASSGLKESIVEEMKNCQKYTERPGDDDFFSQFEISVKRRRRRKKEIVSKNHQENEKEEKIGVEDNYKREAWEWMFLEEGPSPQNQKGVRKRQKNSKTGEIADSVFK